MKGTEKMGIKTSIYKAGKMEPFITHFPGFFFVPTKMNYSSVQFMNDQTRTEFRFKPGCFGRHDVACVSNIH